MRKMILPVVISTLNRLELLDQTIASLQKNTKSELETIVISDASDNHTLEYLNHCDNITFFNFHKHVSIAEVKWKGFEFVSEAKYVYFSDNDVYFEKNWDLKLMKVLETFPDIGVVGGRHHPHHVIFDKFKFEEDEILICEQQAGYSMMLRQEDYKAIGGYEVSDRTKDGGEDTLVCDMIKAKGMKIASIEPPIIIHCGMTNYRGLRASDWHEMMEIQKQRSEVLFL